ncbi:MAG TPA: hypothetical protein VJN43_17375 [Bryobacteraceae bacterium]|nr:hypothetical protein [Bryobacteraceae bacterium]
MSPSGEPEASFRPPAARNSEAGVLKRLAYAIAGILAGDLALLFSLFPYALGLFPIYAVFSVVGWVLVGLPFVLTVPARVLARWPWPVIFIVGAILGPLALLLILLSLAAMQGRLSAFSLSHTETFWPFSILVSTVSFMVYAALARRRVRQ